MRFDSNARRVGRLLLSQLRPERRVRPPLSCALIVILIFWKEGILSDHWDHFEAARRKRDVFQYYNYLIECHIRLAINTGVVPRKHTTLSATQSSSLQTARTM
jgi:hypothetical protein